jgi:acetyl esterase/lipase
MPMPFRFVVFLFLAGLGRTAAAESEPLAPREIVYKQVGDVTLKLFAFGVPGETAAPARAGIVFFFAGGWKTGTPEQFFEQCRHFARRGLVAFSAEYRIESKHQTSAREAVQDAKSCLRWLRSHAASLGLDPARIVAAGGSSGGHLAAACAFVPGFDEPGEATAVSCRPDVLLLLNPVVNTGPSDEGGYGYSRMKGYAREISPQEHVTAGAPPTLFLTGTSDRIIPMTTALRFQEAMQKCGNRCDLFFFSGADHGFFQYKKRDRGFYERTISAMDSFLVSLRYLAPLEIPAAAHP